MVLVCIALLPISAMIELGTDKYVYGQLEPITLNIERYGAIGENKYFGDLNDVASFYELAIQFEHSPSYVYVPSVRGESMGGESQTFVQSAIVSSGGVMITEEVGYYRFQLRDKRSGTFVSNPVIIYVRGAKGRDEAQALEDIMSHKKAYALYVNLGGGEHNTKGHALFKRLSKKRSRNYSRIAHEYLALNYSQEFSDYSGKGKRARKADLKLANHYLTQVEGTENEDVVTMRVLRNAKKHNRNGRLTKKLRRRAVALKKRLKGKRASRGRLFRSIQ